MPRRGKRVRIGEGIYRDAAGLAAVVAVGSGPARLTRERRFPAGTFIKTMRAWQDEVRGELRKRVDDVAPQTLEADVPAYLALVQATLVSFKDRTRDLETWLLRFRHRRRHSLKTRELDAQLRQWRSSGLSASTCNHRRDALSDLFRVLDGPERHNPVKGCIWFKRPEAVPQGISRARIVKVLDALDADSQTKWRLLLIHWTGMRPSQMARLRPTGEDFFLGDDACTLVIDRAPRRVPAILVPAGKGGRAVMVPLTPEGEAAARGFLRTRAFGRWSCPSAYKAIVAAAARVEEAPFNVYRIKHSFASALRRTGTDLADIQDMLGHADISSTRIYAPTVQAKHVLALERLRSEERAVYDQGREADRLAQPDGTAGVLA